MREWLPAPAACRLSVAVWTLVVCAGTVLAQRPSELALDCLTANVRSQQRVCVAADIDADHHPDYAFSPAGRRLSLSLRLSAGDTTVELVAPPGREAYSYALRDVDGDGDLDIALLGAADQTVGVFLNDGDGGFVFDAQDRFLSAPYPDSSRVGSTTMRVAWPCATWNPGTDSTGLESVTAIDRPLSFKPVAEQHVPVYERRPDGSPRTRAP